MKNKHLLIKPSLDKKEKLDQPKKRRFSVILKEG